MDNRQRLMDEAQRLFALQGVDAVGVQEIVDACALTKPTLYHYFGSKEGLLRALLERGFGQLEAQLDQLGPYDRDLPRYLERQAALWLETVRQQPDFFRLQLSLVFIPPANPAHALVTEGLARLQSRMETLFLAAAEQHGNMRGRHRLLAAGWQGTLNHWTGIFLGGWLDPDEAFIRAGLRQFLYGVFS